MSIRKRIQYGKYDIYADVRDGKPQAACHIPDNRVHCYGDSLEDAILKVKGEIDKSLYQSLPNRCLI